MSDKPTQQPELTFEEALSQLEAIVGAIEEGKIGLEESITRYEVGMKLLKRCRSILSDAELKIQKLQETADGELNSKPMDPQ